jgi:hypothetical protein
MVFWPRPEWNDLPQFRYIRLSDTHLCVQPSRRNLQQLVRRDVRGLIDTAREQTRVFGYASLLRPASYAPEIVLGAAQFCFERFESVDGLIATGDLATTGLIYDINAAHSFISAPAIAGFCSAPRTPTIGFLGERVFVLPGNHDKFNDSQGTPNGKNFELKFDGYMPNFEFGVGHWVVEKEGHKLAFIYADFCLQSRSDASDKVVGPFGQGRVYQDILDELTARTLTIRERFGSIPIVWNVHFAPFDCGIALELLDFQNIIDAAVRLRILATLCGHTHKSTKIEIDKHVVYCSGSTGCIDSESDARIHLLHFAVDEACEVTRETFLWNRANHEFEHYGWD